MSSHSSNTQRLQNRAQGGRVAAGSSRPMSATMRFALVYVLALVISLAAVSYTHLTLPTNREV